MNEQLVRDAAAALNAQVDDMATRALDNTTRAAEVKMVADQLNAAIDAPSDTPELDQLKAEIDELRKIAVDHATDSGVEQPTIAEG